MNHSCGLTQTKKSLDKKGVEFVRMWLEPVWVFLGNRLHSGLCEGFGSLLEYLSILLNATQSFNLSTGGQS